MITLILGPMRSGKSKYLYEQALMAGSSAVFIRPKKDTRNFLSRAVECVSSSLIIKNDDVDLIPYQHIFVDELHLCEDSFLDQVIFLGQSGQKDVVLAGLNGDYKQHVFPKIAQLMPYANRIVFLEAVCEECQANSAIYNVGDGKVGDAYRVLCGKCFQKTK